jgi:hypothetical protein
VSKATFIRFCAVSAILAGALRAISSFIPDTTPKIYALYFAIDLFLLFGVTGLCWLPLTGAKIFGRLGLVLMFLALLILIARDVGVVRPDAYAGGAALFSLGLDLFAIQVLLTRKIPGWIPVSWIVSTIAGATGFFAPTLHLLFAISGLLFGVAFSAAGVAMLNLISNADTNSGWRV